MMALSKGELMLYNAEGTELNFSSLQLFNLSGQVLIEKRNISGNQITLHTNYLCKGVYILKGYGGNFEFIKKIMISGEY